MKRGHGEAEYVKAFAEKSGLKIRAAQGHRARNSAEWQSFMEANRKGASGKPQTPQTGQLVPVSGAAAGAFLESMRGAADEISRYQGLTEAAEDEVRAHALWRANIAASIQAATDGDAHSSAAFGKVAADCQRQLLAARRAREADDIRRRSTLPASEFDDFRHALQQVAALVRGLDRELSTRVNPENPAYARAQISAWLRERWNPAVEELIENLGAYSNPEPAAA